MEKMTWSKPVAVVEQFMPNEYIAACWAIRCEVPHDDIIPAGQSSTAYDHAGNYHNTFPTTCGSTSSQYIRSTATKGIYTITEVKVFSRLNCTIYEGMDGNNNYTSAGSTTVALDDSDIGKKIFWTTNYLGGTYHHYGYVSAISDKGTNHS